MYGGSVPRDLKIDAIRQVVRGEEYKRWVEGGRRPQICYLLLAYKLIDIFSYLWPLNFTASHAKRFNDIVAG